MVDALSQPVIAYRYTGDYRIDALLEGLAYRWNATGALGSPVTVTYSFMTAKPIYGGTDSDGDYGFTTFTTQQKTAVRQIMDQLQTELGIRLVEVADSTSSYGQIRFGTNDQTYSAGYAWLPYSTGDDLSGDVWIDNSVPQNLTQVAPGTFAWATLIHEIGHALGLKHPGNYNGGTTSIAQPGNYLGTLEDSTKYTVMSYNDVAGGQQRDWFGMYDLLALKKLYGTGTLNAGATVHSYGDGAGNMLEIIDDASGYDTLDLSALTLPATVDLRPGGFSSVGRQALGRPAVNNLSIDLNTIIEKFAGTAYGDSVIGNDANNAFSLGLGANTANGGAGIDSALYGASRASYQISASGSTLHITGLGVNDTLTGVERAEFADRKLAFDLDGHAGIAAKILGAVFGQDAVTLLPEYAGIGLSLLDAGMSYEGLVQYALDARLGAVHSNAEVANLLYTNVVGPPAAEAQYAPYTAQLDSGTYTQASLGIYAADSDLNTSHIDLAGLAQTGLVYL